MVYTKLKPYLLLIFSVFFINLYGQQKTNPNNQDEELGKVSWHRDYQTAIALSKKEQKPLLILFQEVPGCSTCRNYGHDVLSNPLMTEVIENEFIPLAIFNNKGGEDAKILKKYNEPSWNNPVVRIVNENGDNLVERLASDYSAKGLYKRMEKALGVYGNALPVYMKLLGKEFSVPNTQEAYFKMYCFWSGEKALGAHKDVLTTTAGFMDNHEVVKVVYNPTQVTHEQLSQYALQHKITPIAKTQFRWAEKDEDYYLQRSSFKYLPLSEIQKTKINSALGQGKPAVQFLSPSQKKWLHQISENKSPILYNKDFKKSWELMRGL